MSIAIGPSLPPIVAPLLPAERPKSDQVAARGFGTMSDAALALIQKDIDARARTSTLRGSDELTAPPLLATPRGNAAAATGEPQPLSPYELLALLQDLNYRASDNATDLQLKAFAERAKANQARFKELSERLDVAKGAQDDAVAEAIKASDAAVEAAEAVAVARKEIDLLLAELDGASPGSPEHAALEGQVAAARETLAGAETALRSATTRLEAANAKALAAGDVVEGIVSEIESLVGSSNGQTLRVNNVSHEAKLAELVAAVSELLANAAMDGLTEELAVQQTRLEAQRVENERRAKELEEQQRKAAEAQKTMGCIGKVIGWVVTAVMVVAALPTMGASLALAGVSLGLMIHSEVSGNDILGKAFSPIINGVFGKLIDAVMKAATSLFGEEVGRWVGMVAAAALIVAMVIGATMVVKNVGGKIMEKVAPQIMKALGKVMPEAVKQVGRGVAQARGAALKHVGMQTERGAALATYGGMIQVGAQMGQAGFMLGSTVYTGELRVDEAKKSAAFEEAMLNSEILREMRGEMYEKLEEQMQFINDVVAALMDSITARTAGNAAMMRNFNMAV